MTRRAGAASQPSRSLPQKAETSRLIRRPWVEVVLIGYAGGWGFAALPVP